MAILTFVCYVSLVYVVKQEAPLPRRAQRKRNAHPSCLVGVLYDIYRETNNRSTADQRIINHLYETGHETY